MIINRIKRILSKIKRFLINILEKFGRRYYYVTIYDYALKHPDKAMILSIAKDETVYTEAPTYYPEDANSGRTNRIPELKKGIDIFDWLAVLHDVKCFPWSDIVITSDNKAIYDIKDYYALSQYGDYKDESTSRDTDDYCKMHWTKYQMVEKGFLVEGIFSSNWYHFVTQVLPKMKFVSSIPESVPIIVPPHCKENNNFRQALDIFIKQHAPKRSIIYMPYKGAYIVKTLYVASAQGLLIPNLKKNVKEIMRPEWCLYKQSTIDFIRETMLKAMDTTRAYPDKIYITRKNASPRRSFNEDEIIKFIASEGYAVVAPETYPLAEQIALFHHARCIVACSGAAFTNLLYCQKGCKVIIMNNYRQPIGVFNTIATLVGVESLNVSGYDKDISVVDDIHASFIMPTARLQKAMERMGMML